MLEKKKIILSEKNKKIDDVENLTKLDLKEELFSDFDSDILISPEIKKKLEKNPEEKLKEITLNEMLLTIEGVPMDFYFKNSEIEIFKISNLEKFALENISLENIKICSNLEEIKKYLNLNGIIELILGCQNLKESNKKISTKISAKIDEIIETYNKHKIEYNRIFGIEDLDYPYKIKVSLDYNNQSKKEEKEIISNLENDVLVASKSNIFLERTEARKGICYYLIPLKGIFKAKNTLTKKEFIYYYEILNYPKNGMALSVEEKESTRVKLIPIKEKLKKDINLSEGYDKIQIISEEFNYEKDGVKYAVVRKNNINDVYMYCEERKSFFYRCTLEVEDGIIKDIGNEQSFIIEKYMGGYYIYSNSEKKVFFEEYLKKNERGLYIVKESKGKKNRLYNFKGEEIEKGFNLEKNECNERYILKNSNTKQRKILEITEKKQRCIALNRSNSIGGYYYKKTEKGIEIIDNYGNKHFIEGGKMFKIYSDYIKVPIQKPLGRVRASKVTNKNLEECRKEYTSEYTNVYIVSVKKNMSLKIEIEDFEESIYNYESKVEDIQEKKFISQKLNDIFMVKEKLLYTEKVCLTYISVIEIEIVIKGNKRKRVYKTRFNKHFLGEKKNNKNYIIDPREEIYFNIILDREDLENIKNISSKSCVEKKELEKEHGKKITEFYRKNYLKNLEERGEKIDFQEFLLEKIILGETKKEKINVLPSEVNFPINELPEEVIEYLEKIIKE